MAEDRQVDHHRDDSDLSKGAIEGSPDGQGNQNAAGPLDENGMPRDEFPTFPAVDFAQSWRIRGQVLHDLIRQTSFAVSTEESRPILNGVLWEMRPGHMRMVATNGHRLAKIELPLESVGAPSADLIVPPKALEQIRRLFAAEEDLEIARGDNHLGFRSPFTAVFTRLIEGPYPNYEQVIPRDNERTAVADRNALFQALKRMSIIASDQTHRIRLSFNTGSAFGLFLTARSVDTERWRG